jgi:hypothetical protein
VVNSPLSRLNIRKGWQSVSLKIKPGVGKEVIGSLGSQSKSKWSSVSPRRQAKEAQTAKVITSKASMPGNEKESTLHRVLRNSGAIPIIPAVHKFIRTTIANI